MVATDVAKYEELNIYYLICELRQSIPESKLWNNINKFDWVTVESNNESYEVFYMRICTLCTTAFICLFIKLDKRLQTSQNLLICNLMIVYVAYQVHRIYFNLACTTAQWNYWLFSQTTFHYFSLQRSQTILFAFGKYMSVLYNIIYTAFNINLCLALIETVKNPFNNRESTRLKQSFYWSLAFIIVYYVVVQICKIDYVYIDPNILRP